jgi:hypothetical protein
MARESIVLYNISPEELFTKLNELKREIINNISTPQKDTVREELMTPEDVSLYFKRHKDTIKNWSKKKYLLKHGIGKAAYYKRSEVESAIIPLN